MFHGAYNNCQPHERPKYGCLNIAGSVQGVSLAASVYGKFCLTLQHRVRYRCTNASGDTLNNQSLVLATHDCHAHVLCQYAKPELSSILHGKTYHHVASHCCICKEVQLHGPICLATDIEALYVPQEEATASRKLVRIVQRFQNKTGCRVQWQTKNVSPPPTTTSTKKTE